MKLYLIAIVIAFIGLWISSEVRAGIACGQGGGDDHLEGTCQAAAVRLSPASIAGTAESR